MTRQTHFRLDLQPENFTPSWGDCSTFIGLHLLVSTQAKRSVPGRHYKPKFQNHSL